MEKIQPKSMMANTVIPNFQTSKIMTLKLSYADWKWKGKYVQINVLRWKNKYQPYRWNKSCLLSVLDWLLSCWELFHHLSLPSVISHSTLSPKGSQEICVGWQRITAVLFLPRNWRAAAPDLRSLESPGFPGLALWTRVQGMGYVSIYGKWVYIFHHILKGVHDLPNAKNGV